jgi:uncharacterized SAM-binding protein YcdF (DUF218 family)
MNPNNPLSIYSLAKILFNYLYLRDKLCLQFPDIPPEKIILEDKSTNTGENIQFTLSLLALNYSEFLAPNSIKKLIIVANAYRQRRVWLTCRKYLKDVELINSPPITSFENELKMFEIAGENLNSHLINELERIKTYPAKGFIENSEIPDEILEPYEKLKRFMDKVI